MVKKTNKKTRVWITVTALSVLAVGLAACAPTVNENPAGEREQVLDVRLPAENENGIITAESWASVYPNEYATYMQNSENMNGAEVSDEYPELKILWEGASYATAYHEPNGHTYALEDVSETPRDPQYASCLSCKSSEFILMQTDDPTLNKAYFEDVLSQVTEPISCYDCHENSPADTGAISTRQFFNDAVGEDADKLPEGAMSCGQCHNEYYFPGENKAAANPWNGLAEATPDTILANLQESGYVDHVNPRTGSEMLKVQHPEFETNYGGEMSPMAQRGYSCSDCHMAPSEDENGVEYSSHYWTSPLENEELIANDCANCHADIKAEVAAIQEETVAREHEVADRIIELIDKLEAAVQANTLSEEDLNKARELHVAAQWYWDFVQTENSEGAHNSKLTQECFDKAEAAVDEAMAILG